MVRKVLPLGLLLTAMFLSGYNFTPVQTHTFAEPIDALSIGVQEDWIELEVSAKVGWRWTKWQALEIEKEFDPMLRESNLVIFPRSVTAVRVRGYQQNYEVHPIAVSDEPVSFEVASIVPFQRPRILSRRQWKADDSLLVNGRKSTRSDIRFGETVTVDTSGNSARARECERHQREYPQQFKTTKTITHDARRREFRWPQRYSPSVNRLVIHHTASAVTGDKRSGLEKMRMLYQYHAKSRGWGDIGYHYIVDEDGKIYEGRDGGKYVVGGHAYCANVGTVGIALMGHFDEEEPMQKQMRSLQWLLKELASDYRIDLKKNTSFRGKMLPAIVGHKDVVATSCPGFAVSEVLHQIRRNVRSGRIGTPIRFPGGNLRKASRSAVAWFKKSVGLTIAPVGTPELRGRPGEQQRLSVLLRAGDRRVQRRERIAEVKRSDTQIGLWQDVDGKEMRVRKELLAPKVLQANETSSVRLRVQLPPQEGTYTLHIGDTIYILIAAGRPVDGVKSVGRSRTTTRPLYRPSKGESKVRRPNIDVARITRNRSASALTPKRVQKAAAAPATSNIRIRLSYPQTQRATLSVGRNTKVNNSVSNKFRIDLRKDGDDCVASEFSRELGRGVVRISSQHKPATITSWPVTTNLFRGVIECRIVDGELALINDLPLETYMAGLAEEPDSEPYEKQRAFAIAARSYAAHYMSPDNRKFPGKPYDGNDSPANFQKYGGVKFEEYNPRWVKAVKETRDLVIKKDGHTLKTPYFSRSDGRTKSPKEVGWNRFPFAEVFSSKPDPWCAGMTAWGHGVGMSGCGAKGQALEGKTAEQILEYYYPGTELRKF